MCFACNSGLKCSCERACIGIGLSSVSISDGGGAVVDGKFGILTTNPFL